MTWDGSAVLYAAARWLGYLAAFLIIGAAAFRGFVLPRAAATSGADAGAAAALVARRATQIARLSAVVLAFTLMVRLYFQARSLLEPEDPLTAGFLRLVLASGWGRGWLVQGAATLLALFAWRQLGRAPGSKVAGVTATLSAVALAVAAPLTSHAVALPQAGRFGWALASLHFGAGSVWLGSLGIAALAGWPRRGDPPGLPPTAIFAVYSPMALATGTTTIAAGLLMGWNYLGGLTPLTTTGYGKTLLLKVATLIGVAATGLYNWRVVVPRLKAGNPAPIRRSATIELWFGTILLAITAVLVALPPPGE